MDYMKPMLRIMFMKLELLFRFIDKLVKKAGAKICAGFGFKLLYFSFYDQQGKYLREVLLHIKQLLSIKQPDNLLG